MTVRELIEILEAADGGDNLDRNVFIYTPDTDTYAEAEFAYVDRDDDLVLELGI